MSETMSTQTLSLSCKDKAKPGIWGDLGDLGRALIFSSTSLRNPQKPTCHRNKRDLRLARSALRLSLGSPSGSGERGREGRRFSPTSHQGLEQTDSTGNSRIWSGNTIKLKSLTRNTILKTLSSLELKSLTWLSRISFMHIHSTFLRIRDNSIPESLFILDISSQSFNAKLNFKNLHYSQGFCSVHLNFGQLPT